MSRSFNRGVVASIVFVVLAVLGFYAPPAMAQTGTVGTVTVSVIDPENKAVPGADLTLQDLATNDTRTATTQDQGNFSFVNLPLGTYKLTVAKSGFQTQVFDTVVVHAAQVTDLQVSLKVGVATETVEVTAAATPLIDTTSNAIGTNIDMKQIEDLPLGGRDLGPLSTLVPGTAAVPNVGPTWNGLPVMAQGGNIDGVIGSTNRMKFAGNGAEPDVSPRIEDISEMTVQTNQIDLNQGFGQSTMQLNFVTRRGSNSFHGRAFDDFQNSYLNANSWQNDAVGSPKNALILNNFGGSVGGPILKNKLFFFGTYAESKQPGSFETSNVVLTQLAQAGVFSYVDASGNSQQVCLFTATCPGGGKGIVDNYNAAHPGSDVQGTNFPVPVNGSCSRTINGLTMDGCATVAGEQSNINGILSLGQLGGTGDPNLLSLNWASANAQTNYYPTVRVDYNMSQNMRFNVAWNMSKYETPNSVPDTFPGAPFAGTGGGSVFKYYTGGFGFDWTVKPTLVNQFRGGYLYHFDGFGTVGFNNIEQKFPTVGWAFGNSGQSYNLPTPDYYPVVNVSDTATWQHGSHTVNFGMSFYREQDHYWNAPAGFAQYGLGLANGDPALNMFDTTSVPNATGTNLGDIENLYSTLTGRISGVAVSNAYNTKTGQYNQGCNPCLAYNLDERSQAWGLFVSDSYRFRPNLTLNYGLRWDFTAANKDLTDAYHSVTLQDQLGPSGIQGLFNPGVLQGNPNPMYNTIPQPYNNWNISPQPTVGLAWSPQYSEGILGKLLGNGSTVIRTGLSLRNYIEPYQYMWNYATDTGSFYYQSSNLNPGPSGVTGFFAPGSLSLNGTGNDQLATLPPFLSTPAAYQKTAPMSEYTFLGFNPDASNTSWGFDPHIKQPYTISWNFGIQKQLGPSNAIEIRYIGNRNVHQWLGLNTNEVNIFAKKGTDPTFLQQFQQAQQNYTINFANKYDGATDSSGNLLPGHFYPTFANLGFGGEAAMPIFDAAFAGENPGTGGNSGEPFVDYGNGQFISWLKQGQAANMAQLMTTDSGGLENTNYFCNLVGASFAPCANNVGYTGGGAGYPINYFQANPYETGGGTLAMTSGGYSNYNALQVDFRQKQWHGMQFDANYTWQHNLGLQTSNDWLGLLDNAYTIRNLRLNYGPTLYDLRNSINASGTYDLPFGLGKQFLHTNALLDRIVGGWTLGTIFTWNSGSPFALSGGYQTYAYSPLYGNQLAGGGVVLNGISRTQLQDAVGVFPVSLIAYQQAHGCTQCAPTYVETFNPSILKNPLSGGANPSLMTPNSAAGTIASPIYLHGPHYWNDDLAVTKYVPIRENLRFSLQGEFLNIFNHPDFGPPRSNVQSSSFGRTFGPDNGPRAIELRANLEF